MEAMRKYAVFAGRARRREYWMFQFVNSIVLILLVAGIVFRPRSPMAIPALLLLCGYVLATMIPALAVSVRRLHDTNLSGWWLLISLVPLGGFVLFVFHVLDSTPGPNQYGPNPKAVGSPAYASQHPAYGTQAMASAAGASSDSQSSQWFLGFCNRCGTQIAAGSRFCPKCGQVAY